MGKNIDDLNPILTKITRPVAAIKSLRFSLFVFVFRMVLDFLYDILLSWSLTENIRRHSVHWNTIRNPAELVNATTADSIDYYRKISSIRHTESHTLNVSCLVLQLSVPNHLKPGVKSRMKMQRRQAMLQLHLSDQQFYYPPRCVLY